MKNGTTCEELLAWRPWTTCNADINTEIAWSTHATGTEASGSGGDTTGGPAPVLDADADLGATSWVAAASPALSQVSVEGVRAGIEQTADRLARRLTLFVVEPRTQQNLGDLIAASPLANVKATPETGDAIVLMDCNTYAETDVQPDLRQCPIAVEVMKKLLRGVLLGMAMLSLSTCVRETCSFALMGAGTGSATSAHGCTVQWAARIRTGASRIP